MFGGEWWHWLVWLGLIVVLYLALTNLFG